MGTVMMGPQPGKTFFPFIQKHPFLTVPLSYRPLDVIVGVKTPFETQRRIPNRILIEI